MNKRAIFIAQRRQQTTRLWLSSLIVLLVFLVLLVTWNNRSIENLNTTEIYLFTLASAVLYAVAGHLTDKAGERGLEAATAFVLLVSWLTLGLDKALFILFAGSIAHRGFIVYFNQLSEPHQPKLSLLTLWESVRQQIAINGIALMFAHIAFEMLDGSIPVDIEDVQLPALLATVILTSIVARLSMAYFLGGSENAIQTSSATTLRNIIQSIFLPLVSVPVAILFQDEHFGLPEFAILEAIILYLMIRSTQLSEAQINLESRVHEATLLESIVEEIARELDPQHVIKKTYDWVKTYTNTHYFFIATYDEDNAIVNFPLVMLNDQSIHKDQQSIDSEPWLKTIIENQTIQIIHRNQSKNLPNFLNSLPDTPNYQRAICIPLVVGTKLLGFMTIVMAQDKHFQTGTLETVAHHISLALRNATLYDRSMRFSKILSAINHDVREIMFNLDGEEAMLAACKAALEITSAQKVVLLLLEHADESRLNIASQINLSKAHQAFYLRQPVIFSNHQTINHIVPDIRQLDPNDPVRQLAERENFCAFAEILLQSGHAIIGKLIVFHDQRYYYEATEIELLDNLAHQIASTMDNVELLNALEVYASEQAQLVHLSTIATSSLNLNDVLQQVTTMLQQMLSIKRSIIGLVLPGQTLMKLYDSGSAEIPVFNMAEIPEITNIIHQGQTEQQLYIRHHNNNSPELEKLIANLDCSSLAIIPMATNSLVIGLVILGNDEGRKLTDSEWRFVEMATNQLTTQIYNIQLYQETQESLHRRLRELGFIEDIAQQISQSLNLKLVIRSVLQAAIEATQADISILALSSPDKQQLNFVCLEQIGGELIDSEFTEDATSGLMSVVIQSGETMIVPRNASTPGYTSAGFSGTYASSAMVPLIHDGLAIGALGVESRELDFFNDERMKFIKNLAGHASISIQNARLLQERQEQIETLSQLRQLSVNLSNTIDATEAYPFILQATLAILHVQDAQIIGYDKQTNALSQLAQLSNMTPSPDQDWLPEATLHEIIEHGQTRIISKQEHPDLEIPEVFDSVIVTLIKRESKSHELLCVAYRNPYSRMEEERSNIELLAFQVAGHLENLKLYAQIRANNNQMRAILDSTRDGILLLDKEGHLVEGNVSAERLLNLSLDETIGTEFSQTIHNITLKQEQKDLADKGLQDLARHLRLNPRNISRHAFQIRINGQIRHIEEVESPVFDQHTEIIGRLLTLRDITEEILLEEYREEVIHMLVHDLRDPLSSIIGSMNFMEDTITSSPEPDELLTQLMQVSINSATNLYDMVETILDIYKMEDRRLPLSLKDVTIIEIIDSVISKLTNKIQEAEISIIQDIPDDTPPVYVDSDLIHRVLINLLGNAIRFTPSGGQILFQVNTDDLKRRITVRVADSGPGIPPGESERVFEKFRQIENHIPQRGHKGSGIGLAFCKTAIEAHDQQIWTEQDGPLSGACFAFTLPYKPV